MKPISKLYVEVVRNEELDKVGFKIIATLLKKNNNGSIYQYIECAKRNFSF